MEARHGHSRSAADGRKINLADAPTGPRGERVLAAGERLGLRIWVEERPVNGAVTTREHETVGFALKGRALLALGDRRLDLVPGDSWVVPAGVPHAYRIAHSFAAVEATAPPAQGGGAALQLRDSGATMGSGAAVSVGSSAVASRRVDPAPSSRPAASSAAAAEQHARPYATPPRVTEAGGPHAPAAVVSPVRETRDVRPALLNSRTRADDFARRHIRRHDLARRLRGSPASVFALLRSGDGPERWLPDVPSGHDYVRFVGEHRRLEWGASDDSWQAWFDAHAIHGNLVEIQASVTTAYDLGDPRTPSATEVMTELRALLESVGHALHGGAR